MRFLMSEGDQQSATEEGQSLLHRLGHFGSTIGKKAPKKRSTRDSLMKLMIMPSMPR